MMQTISIQNFNELGMPHQFKILKILRLVSFFHRK